VGSEKREVGVNSVGESRMASRASQGMNEEDKLMAVRWKERMGDIR